MDPSGWMPGVEHIENTVGDGAYVGLGIDQMYPEAIVYHVAQGYMRTLKRWAMDAEPGKSYHFAIGRDGEIVQCRSIWNPAIHAGILLQPTAPFVLAQGSLSPNRYTVGIEMEGFSVDPGYSYDYLYGPGDPWPEAQLQAVIRVTEWVISMYLPLLQLKQAGDRAGLAQRLLMHSEIDGVTRRNDPGVFWRATCYDRILDALVSPAPVVEAPRATVMQMPDEVARLYDLVRELDGLRERLLNEVGAVERSWR